jgi:hypothetical protein
LFFRKKRSYFAVCISKPHIATILKPVNQIGTIGWWRVMAMYLTKYDSGLCCR